MIRFLAAFVKMRGGWILRGLVPENTEPAERIRAFGRQLFYFRSFLQEILTTRS